jgi:hypothetical protein
MDSKPKAMGKSKTDAADTGSDASTGDDTGGVQETLMPGPPTGAEAEGKAWVIDAIDVPEGTKYEMRPFVFDTTVRVLCTCGYIVGDPDEHPPHPPYHAPPQAELTYPWVVNQVSGEYVVDNAGNVTPRYNVRQFEWDPQHRVVCGACGAFVGEPKEDVEENDDTENEEAMDGGEDEGDGGEDDSEESEGQVCGFKVWGSAEGGDNDPTEGIDI